MRFKIFKNGVKNPRFCSNDREVAERVINGLRHSFFLTIGNAKPIVEKFPFRLEESK